MIQQRNIFKIIILSLLTFGIYYVYWLVQTKNELHELDDRIPTAWLLIIPIANWYFYYTYIRAYAQYIKKNQRATISYYLFFMLPSILSTLVYYAAEVIFYAHNGSVRQYAVIKSYLTQSTLATTSVYTFPPEFNWLMYLGLLMSYIGAVMYFLFIIIIQSDLNKYAREHKQ